MTNKNLATKNTTDFTVLDSGEAYISQRKAAELLGVNPNTFMKWVRQHTNKGDTKQGLTPDLLQKGTQYYAYKGNTTCQELMGKLLEAGAKAYIYHEAGYVISAKPKESALPDFSNPAIAARAWADKHEALEKTQGELKGANARQIKERVLSIQDTCQDIRNQHPELGITERRMIKLLRVNKMIYSHSTKPLVRQNKTIGFTLSSGGDRSGNKITYVKTEFKTNFNTWVMENCGTPKTPKVKIPPPPPKKEAHPNDLFYYFQAMCEPEEYTRSQLHSFGFSDEMIARDHRISKTPF